VAVTVVHEGGGTNRLDEARQALRTQTAAREHAERQLHEAQATIEGLRTQLVHERMARDEAVQRAEGRSADIEQALLAIREELAAESQARQRLEQERDEAVASRQEAEERLRGMTATMQPQQPRSGDAKSADASVQEGQPRRRGRPRKVEASQSEFVEWWKPGWRKQFS
jgi:hypothetical protein